MRRESARPEPGGIFPFRRHQALLSGDSRGPGRRIKGLLAQRTKPQGWFRSPPSAKKGKIMGRAMFRKILLLLGLSAATVAGAQAATRPILYVANSQGDDVTVIDLPTQKVLT